MFKSILLPVDGSQYSSTATEYAIQAARHYKASILALYVIDVKKLAAPLVNDVATCLGISSVPNLEEVYRNTLRQIGETTLENCRNRCVSSQVDCKTLIESGVVSDVICAQAHKVDLVVMGHRGEASRWGSSIFGSVFEATIRQISRPVFVVSKLKKDIRKFLVAYDGSNHASRALRVVAEVCLAENLPLHVLLVGQEPDPDPVRLKEVSEFLAPYKLDWKLEKAIGDAADAIISKATEINADVIAMGAFGHSRIKELIVGSTTEFVIRNASCPVLVYR